MAKNDELDTLLRDPRMTDKDFRDLYEALSIDKSVPVLERVVFINKEIRHAYGHTISNLWREWYDPDYSEIIRATAKKLRVPEKPNNTVEELEGKILVEIIERAREQIIKEKGVKAWKDIEKSVEAEIMRLIAEGKIPSQVADEFEKLRGAGLIAGLIAGRFAGFALYIFANQLIFAIGRLFAVTLSVFIVGPIIGRTLSFLLGPAGWLLGGLLIVFDLGKANWGKVIPAITMVILLRLRLKAADEDEGFNQT